MLVTLLSSPTLISALQPLNALAPMLVTLLRSPTLASELQP